MTVVGDRVIVRTETPSEFERGGLIVLNDEAPDTVGTVIAVGDVSSVRVDDVVIFPPEAGTPLDYDGARYLVLHEEELLAVVE